MKNYAKKEKVVYQITWICQTELMLYFAIKSP